jgi:hypothetical protein
MPPLQFPLEIILMFARLLTYEEGSLRFADFNSFLQVNRALYHIKKPRPETSREWRRRRWLCDGCGDGCGRGGPHPVAFIEGLRHFKRLLYERNSWGQKTKKWPSDGI